MELLVAICDDEKEIRNAVELYLSGYFKRRRVRTSITKFSDGKELLNSNIIFDIIVLDIQMYKVDGITVKNILFEKQAKSKIIFLSDYDTYMKEAFGRNVYAFVKKNEIHKLETQINIIVNEFLEHRMLKITDVTMDLHDIVYIEADDSYCHFHLLDKVLTVRKGLNAVDEILQPYHSFCRIHRSYIVHLKYVKQLRKDNLTLSTGENIPVSRMKVESLRKMYIQYVRHMISDGE